jgi:hypothetical protein
MLIATLPRHGGSGGIGGGGGSNAHPMAVEMGAHALLHAHANGTAAFAIASVVAVAPM